MSELESKITLLRQMLVKHNFAGFCFRGTDWFAWVTGGFSNTVLQTAETGIAEVLVTQRDVFILTDAIEAERVRNEQSPDSFLLWSAPWQDPAARKMFLLDQTRGGLLASDRPRGVEYALPAELYMARRELLPEERDRYRLLGREAAEAMTDTLLKATPSWTENQLAAEGASALWRRGIDPALILVGGETRLPLYRHPLPSTAPLGDKAMLVFCARRHGLYANLTRFVYFRKPSKEEEKKKLDVAKVESIAWDASRSGIQLSEVYKRLVTSYESLGYADEPNLHHQGGPTGYLAREEIATPHSEDVIKNYSALAWNPSITGTKIEDTILVRDNQVEILTTDERWPTFSFSNRNRPDYLVKT